MSCLLLADCLNEIFENLEEDKITLHSCLLVNRLWCKISVRILWRNICSFEYFFKESLAILSTLVACLPGESKELLHKNGIFISTPTLKPPVFNYASFSKVLSIEKIDEIIISRRIYYNKGLILQEILKMFMKQVSSLKEMKYNPVENIAYIKLTYFPRAGE